MRWIRSCGINIPEPQNMQAQLPRQMSNMGLAQHEDICLDHMSKHRPHPSKPVHN